MPKNILTGLHLISIFLVFSILNSIFTLSFFFKSTPLHFDRIANSEISAILFTVHYVFLGVLAFITLMGLLLKQKWGWYLGCFYFISGILRNASSLIASIFVSNASYNLLPVLIPLMIDIFFCIVLFNPQRTEIFQLTKSQQAKSVYISIGTAVLLYVISSTILSFVC